MQPRTQYSQRESGLYVPGDHDELIKRHAMPGVGVPSSAGGAAMMNEGWTPADLANQLARWDMVDSTVNTTTGGDVTSVSDLVGSYDLGIGFSSFNPSDVTSSSTLGNRRACQHVRTSSESLATSTLPDESMDFSVWIVFFTPGPFTVGQGIWGDAGAFYHGGGIAGLTAGDPWYMNGQSGAAIHGSTTPSINTSYVVVWNVSTSTSSIDIYVNGSAETLSTGQTPTNAGDTLADFEIGMDYNSGTFADMTWTAAGVLTSVMSASDIADLETWRSNNAA